MLRSVVSVIALAAILATAHPVSADPVAASATVPLVDADAQPAAPASPRSRVLALVLVGVGAMLLLDNLGRFFGFPLSNVVIPVILVGLGVYLLRGSRKRERRYC